METLHATFLRKKLLLYFLQIYDFFLFINKFYLLLFFLIKNRIGKVIILKNMENLQKLYESNNSTIFKGNHKDFKNEILIKVLKTDAPTESQLTRFENEYSLTHNIKIKNVRKVLKIAQFSGKNALLLEYFDGNTLKNIHSQKKENLKNKNLLSIAINIAQTIGEIHEQNIIHKDLTSNNILVNKFEQITIIDFGLSAKYNFKAQGQTNATGLQGTITYISPEQTRRINRGIDFRSDLYSLGIILYELFTQQLPFQYEDSLQLIHAHISKKPIPPHEVNPLVPKILSDIILKLLSKNPEERYQSAFGLKHDLEFVFNHQASSDLDAFQLGNNDFSGKLTIPEKTYGQEAQIEQILQSYDRASSGSAELLIVSGKSGVGKSAVVHEIIPTVIEKNGIFIEGKFDEFQKDIPFYAFQQAFEQFVRIILNETEEKIIYWTKLIQKAVGELGKILTNILPELELIIGKQPEIPELEGIESLNRFNYLWTNFIKNISKSKHSLVLLLKDIHYADSSSIELLETLLTDKEINYFLCITAFNTSKIAENEQFKTLRQDLEKENIRIENVEVKNFAQKTLSNFLSDILNLKGSINLSKLEDLAGLIYSKTSGNPFFTKELLKKIYEEELLKFDYQKKQWTWKHSEIEKYHISDNVVKFLADKIKQLPEQTQDILDIAACYGNIFDLKIISCILQKEIKETKKDLELAITEGIIATKDKSSCQFAHTQLFQAVYSLISETEKKQFHSQIGQILLENTPKTEIQNNIFEIVNQLNYSIDSKEFRPFQKGRNSDEQSLAELNFMASQKAKSTVAFDTAYKYIEIASKLLPENSWQKNYKFTLQIYNEHTELAYLTGKYDKTDELVNFVVKNAKEILDTTDAHSILINSYTSQTKYDKAIEIGRKLIGQLGLKIPFKVNKIYLIQEFIKTQIAIGRKKGNDLANLPLMTDKKQLSILKLVNSLGSAVYLASPEIFPIMVLKSIRIFIKYGNCKYSPYLYSGYAIVMTFMNKFDKGIEFGSLATSLIPELKAEQDSAKINFVVNAFNKVWKNSIHVVAPLIFNTFKIGSEIGDIEYASYGQMNVFYNFSLNIPIQQLQSKAIEKIKILEKLQQEYSLKRVLSYIQIIDNLISVKENPCSVKGDYFDEDIEIPKFIHSNNHSFLSVFYVNKLFLHIIFSDLSNSIKYLIELELDKYQDINRGTYYFVINNFYRSIVYLRLYEKEGGSSYLKKQIKIKKK